MGGLSPAAVTDMNAQWVCYKNDFSVADNSTVGIQNN